MRTALLLGLCFGLGLSIAVAVPVLTTVTVMAAWGRGAAWRRDRRVIREAVTELDFEDIVAMLRGDTDTEEKEL